MHVMCAQTLIINMILGAMISAGIAKPVAILSILADQAMDHRSFPV